MTKFSGINIDSSPSAGDYLIGVTSGGVDLRATLQDIAVSMLSTHINPCDFSVYMAMTGTYTGFVKVQHDTKEWDVGSDFDTTLHRFVARVNGIYEFHAAISFTATSSGQKIISTFYKNGIEEKRGTENTAGGNNYQEQASASIKLDAGDYVEHWCDAPGLVVNNNSIQTWFQGHFRSSI